MKRSLLCRLALALACSVCAQAAENFVYILTGQSNSLGAVKGSPATVEQLNRYESHGLLWSGNMERDTGKPFDANPSWQKVQPQLPRYSGSLCMGPEYGFAHMMERRGWHSGADKCVCIIKASLDGGGNSFWLPGRPAYLTLSKTIKAGLAALPGKSHVRALLYLQGESDKGEEIALAPQRFQSLNARLQKEVKKGLKFAVVGQCATWFNKDTVDEKGNTTAKLMEALAKSKKSIGWVRTRDLEKISSGDNMGVHYNGISQISIGARYAYAVAVLEKLPLGFVRSDKPDAALNSPEAWWGGKLPKASDVLTWDIAAFRGEDKLSSPFSVSGLMIEDPPGGKVSIGGAALYVGAQGIVLKEGDLALACGLVTTADQTWKIASARTLKISSLSGSGLITVQAPADAVLELHLREAPSHAWRLPDAMPRIIATIAGAPAHFVKHGAVYKLEPQR